MTPASNQLRYPTEAPRDVWVISGHTFLHSCGAALCMLSVHAINPGSAGVLSLRLMTLRAPAVVDMVYGDGRVE